jgi:hypothetical protein
MKKVVSMEFMNIKMEHFIKELGFKEKSLGLVILSSILRLIDLSRWIHI